MVGAGSGQVRTSQLKAPAAVTWSVQPAILPWPNAPYRVVDGLSDPGALERADWVVTTLGAELRIGYGAENPRKVFKTPYDAALLRSRFEEVHTVKRAFDLEVARVWRRRAAAGSR